MYYFLWRHDRYPWERGSLKMWVCTGRWGCDLGLVLRHTFPSFSKRPCNPCLGGFSKSKYFFTYLVVLKSCAQSVLFGSQMTEQISCLQAHCTGFMGSRSRWCRDIMRCSVIIRDHAQGQWEKGVKTKGKRSSGRLVARKSWFLDIFTCGFHKITCTWTGLSKMHANIYVSMQVRIQTEINICYQQSCTYSYLFLPPLWAC